MKQSLGLIETYGLCAGIEAADAAVKSANVTLIGYELAMGDGMTTIKISGDVGAVKAAVDSAKAAASKVGQVASAHVIPRPAENLAGLVFNKRTLGSMPGARADVKGNSPLSASYVPPAPMAEAKPVAKPKPEPAPKAEPKPAPKPAPKTEPKPAPKPEPKAEPKPAPKPEPKAESAPKAEIKPAPKHASGPEKPGPKGDGSEGGPSKK
nr:BMC domain-containing protein [Paratractidigestivibacter sp.]